MGTKAKKVSESRTEQVHIIMPGDCNGTERLFGGELMRWIDVVAAVVARRHAGMDVTTAFVDGLEFVAPAHMNETIIIVGCLTYVGRSSMEVSLYTYVEALDGSRKLVNHAYFIMVAVDEENNPQQVPGLILETDEERAEWEAGKCRHRERKNRRTEA